MPAQAACPVLHKEAPSVLHLIQPAKGGVQINSIILVARLWTMNVDFKPLQDNKV
jgi:hypothetical protein